MTTLAKSFPAADVIDLYDDGNGGVQSGFTNVANNLPGVMQYLDLIRTATFAFSLPNLPPNVVEEQDALTGEEYAHEDARLQQRAVVSTEYDRDEQLDRRDNNRQRKQMKKAEKEAIAGAVGAKIVTGAGGSHDTSCHTSEGEGFVADSTLVENNFTSNATDGEQNSGLTKEPVSGILKLKAREVDEFSRRLRLDEDGEGWINSGSVEWPKRISIKQELKEKVFLEVRRWDWVWRALEFV